MALTQMTTMAQGPQLPWRDDDEAEEYARDPRAFLLERCAAAMENSIYSRAIVVCATYYLPAFEVLPNGHRLHRAPSSQDEALWQGKVGLIIGKGALAFQDEGGLKFGGFYPKIGDWVQWDIHDARQFTINRIHCRWMSDTQVIAQVKNPKLVY